MPFHHRDAPFKYTFAKTVFTFINQIARRLLVDKSNVKTSFDLNESVHYFSFCEVIYKCKLSFAWKYSYLANVS